MSAEVPGLPGTWWCYYTDAEGRRVVLTTSVAGRKAHVVTSAGERLLFSSTELGTLVENLQGAAAEMADR